MSPRKLQRAERKRVGANIYGGGIYEFARAAVQTQDGHFVFAGETRSSAIKHALQVFEIDQDGKLQWMIDVGGAVQGDAAFGLTEVIGPGLCRQLRPKAARSCQSLTLRP